MSHAVHFRSSDGSTTFEPVGSLEDALARVERLRNDEGVSEVRVYREVPVAFRAYYKATVVEDEQQPEAPAAAAAPAAGSGPATPASPPPGAMPLAPPPTSANGRDDSVLEGPGDADAPDDESDSRGGRGSLFSRG